MIQSDDNKRGEVAFRAMLFEQQVAGTSVLGDELDRDSMLALMRSRMEKSRRDFAALAAAGYLRAPFLELGAERCQRSLVLANDFGLDGFAADLSFHSLQYADFLARSERLGRLPQRLCCDAYQLPLADNSIGFAFCYQTLHHFPDPAPVIAELYRVLRPGAVLYIDEEPIKRALRLALWKRKTSPSASGNRYVRFLRNYVLDIVSEADCNEVGYGICENDNISLRQWEAALGALDTKQIHLKLFPMPKVLARVRHRSERWGLRSYLCEALGGTLTASVVPKPGRPDPAAQSAALACPVCHTTLKRQASGHACHTCNAEYPHVEGVSVLLPEATRARLYPDLAKP